LTAAAVAGQLTGDKGKPDQSQRRKATGPRFLQYAVFGAQKDPKTAGLPQQEVLPRPEKVMTSNTADFVLHIDETLPPDQLKTIESHLLGMGGVLTATNRDDKPHLILVTYDPEKVKSHDILVKVESEGVHAELVGL
jgi:hypothetical protein